MNSTSIATNCGGMRMIFTSAYCALIATYMTVAVLKLLIAKNPSITSESDSLDRGWQRSWCWGQGGLSTNPKRVTGPKSYKFINNILYFRSSTRIKTPIDRYVP